MASCDCNEMASGFNPLHLHQKPLKSPPKHSFLVYGVGCAHSTWRALEFIWKLRSKMTHIISLSVLLVCSFCLLPHKRIFFSPVEQTGLFPRSYHFRTLSIAAITRLMSSLALLRVSARTDLPDIPATR